MRFYLKHFIVNRSHHWLWLTFSTWWTDILIIIWNESFQIPSLHWIEVDCYSYAMSWMRFLVEEGFSSVTCVWCVLYSTLGSSVRSCHTVRSRGLTSERLVRSCSGNRLHVLDDTAARHASKPLGCATECLAAPNSRRLHAVWLTPVWTPIVWQIDKRSSET